MTVVVDCLEVWSITKVVLQHGIRDLRVEYRDSTVTGRALAAMMGIEVSGLEYSMARPPAGGGPEVLRWKVDRELLSATEMLADRLMDVLDQTWLPAADISDSDIRLYLEKTIRREIKSDVELLVLASDRAAKPSREPCRVLVRAGPLSGLLEDWWRDEAVGVTTYGSGRRATNRLKDALRRTADRAREHFYALRRRLGVGPTFSISEPTVAVQLVEGLDLSARTELFWVPSSGVDATNIVLYGHEGGIGGVPSEDQMDTIRNRGYHWIPLERSVSPVGWRGVWAPAAGTHEGTAGHSANRPGPATTAEQRWLRRACRRLRRRMAYWRAFFREHSVRVHVLIEEGGVENVAQRAALRVEGGVTIGRQRSDHFVGGATRLGHYPTDMFLTWNDSAVDAVVSSRSRVPVCIATGFVYDIGFGRNEETVRELRTSFDDSVEFVVAVLDNVWSDELHFSREVMEEFYESLVAWARMRESVGLLVKPKKRAYYEGLGSVPALMGELEDRGRATVVTKPGAMLTSTVSRAADITVGIGVSSAVTEALIAGQRAVYCETSGCIWAPQYDWAEGSVLFASPEETVSALEAARSEDDEQSPVGRAGPNANRLDRYRDGRGAERAGRIVGELYRKLSRGQSCRKAVEVVAAEYGEKWGNDAVHWSEHKSDLPDHGA